MATKKTTPCSTVGCSSGWKISESTTAIGTHRAMTTTFQPAKKPMS